MYFGGGIFWLLERLFTNCTFGERSLAGGEISAPVQGVPETQPVPCTMCNVVIPGVKLPEIGVDKQHTLSSVVKERIDLSPPRDTNCCIQI